MSGSPALRLRNVSPGRRFIPGHGVLGPGDTCQVEVALALRLVGEGLELVPR
jgi:hypothetical protein